jgi:2-oxoglutarate ferredoxin oxidoreductase subunit beta
LVHVLSPCVTFRPEQRGYKTLVHDGFGGAGFDDGTPDRREAFRRLMEDDGYSCGVLFKGQTPAFKPHPAEPGSIEEIQGSFAL